MRDKSAFLRGFEELLHQGRLSREACGAKPDSLGRSEAGGSGGVRRSAPPMMAPDETAAGVSRRTFIERGAVTGAAASLVGLTAASPAEGALPIPGDLNEATIADLQVAMAAGHLDALTLALFYLARIRALDQGGPKVNSIIEINHDVLAIARARDAERRAGFVRGPLHGIPVVLKDNIDTADRMQSAAGSFALVGVPAVQDATVAAKLRAAGAVILGKTTLSEWANFRSFYSSSGWSGRGGQCNNPYALDRNPCGSSSGSGAAPSANFTAVSIGTETDGSIVCPASINGVVGLKPTVGLVSRAGVVPISHTQDTVGPHSRTVADAAITLDAIVSRTADPRDAATFVNRDKIPADYTSFLDPDGLAGARIGVARLGVDGASPKTAVVFDEALAAMADAGAILIDVEFPHQDEINSGTNEFTVLLFDFKKDLQAYLATRVGVPIAGGTLADAIAFNNAHAAEEMPFFAQEIFELADLFDITDPNAIQPLGVSYNDAVAADFLFGATEGIDQLLAENDLHAIVAATGTPSWPTDLINADHFTFASSTPAAIAGYPIINVPMGFSFGLPLGISFMGTAFSEGTLIKLASGFEHVGGARRPPKFLRTLPFDTKGLKSPVRAPSSASRSRTGKAVVLSGPKYL